jgi:DNA-directed RNA polymerase specialized sigma24 family protein
VRALKSIPSSKLIAAWRRELDPETAEILILKYVHSYKDADIARVIGTSRGAIAMRLLRSRSRLKKLMRELSGESK